MSGSTYLDPNRSALRARKSERGLLPQLQVIQDTAADTPSLVGCSEVLERLHSLGKLLGIRPLDGTLCSCLDRLRHGRAGGSAVSASPSSKV